MFSLDVEAYGKPLPIEVNVFVVILAWCVSIVGAYSALSFTETLIMTRIRAGSREYVGSRGNAGLLVMAAAVSVLASCALAATACPAHVTEWGYPVTRRPV